VWTEEPDTALFCVTPDYLGAANQGRRSTTKSGCTHSIEEESDRQRLSDAKRDFTCLKRDYSPRLFLSGILAFVAAFRLTADAFGTFTRRLRLRIGLISHVGSSIGGVHRPPAAIQMDRR